MSGKHDRSLDDDQSAKLLLTGPIVIRGLGRSVKDAFRPGRPSRHRAFVEAEAIDDQAVPIETLLESAPAAQEDAQPFPPADAVDQTGRNAGLGEDRVDDRRADDAPPSDSVEESPVDGDPQDRHAPVADEARPEALAGEAPLDETDSVAGPDDASLDAIEAEEGEAFDAAIQEPEQAEELRSDEAPGPSTSDLPDDTALAAIEAEEGDAAQEATAFDEGEPAPESNDDADVGSGSEPEESSDGEPASEPESLPETGFAPEQDGALDDPAAESDRAEEQVSATEPSTEPDAPPVDQWEPTEQDVPAADGEPEPEPEPEGEHVAEMGAGAWTEPEAHPVDAHESGESFDAEPTGDAESATSDAEAQSEVDADPAADEIAEAVTEDAASTSAHTDTDASADTHPPAEPAWTDGSDHGDAVPGEDDGAASDPEHAGDAEAVSEPEAAEVAGDESEPDRAAEGEHGELSGADAGAEAMAGAEQWGEAEPIGDPAVAEVAGSESEPDQTPEGEHREPSGSETETEPVAEAGSEQWGEAEQPADPDAADAPGAGAAPEDEQPADAESRPASEHASEAEPEESAEHGSSQFDGADSDTQGVSPAEPEVDAAPTSEGEPVVDQPESEAEAEAEPHPGFEPGSEQAPGEDPSADAVTEPEFEQPPAEDASVDAVAEPEPSAEGESESAGGATSDERVDADEEGAAGEEADADPVADQADAPGEDAAPAPEDTEESSSTIAVLVGERGWTTAEELYSRPITVIPPASTDATAEDAPAVDPDLVDDSVAESEVPEDAPETDEGDVREVDEPPMADEPPVTDETPASADPTDATDAPAREPDAPAAVAAPAIVTTPERTKSAAKPPRTPRPPRPRPARERFGREAIGIAVLVVLALICGGLITAVVLKTQRDAAIAASEAANYTPPPLATPEPTATGPVVAVIGDETTTSAASGVDSGQRWNALLGSALDGTVRTDAASGMGYATKSSGGETFVQAAAKVPSNASVVVFFGGAADANVAPLSLAKAATDAFAAAKKQAPDAKILVVGPAISGGASSSDLTAIRNSLRSSAGIAKATWIDPIGDEWLTASDRAATSPSALSATDEKTLASKMEAAIKKALG